MTRTNSVYSATRTVHLSELNKRRVIDVLLETESCSRREISERTHLAPSTVSTIISELLESGFIRRVGKRDQAASGRREELIGRNPRAAAVVTVHYTTDACTVGLVDFGLNVAEESAISLTDYNGEHLHWDISAHVQGILEHYDEGRKPLGVALSLPNHPVREKVVTKRVADSLETPVVGLNNVAAMAVYYNYLAARERSRTFSLVYVGSGIGSGFVINGEVYHGVNGKASDLGHVHIKDSEIVCRCGRTGCVETFASLGALSRDVADYYRHEVPLRGDELVAFLGQQLWSGDEYVRRLLDEASESLAKGMRNLAALLDPGRVLVVSRLNRLNPYFEERVREHFYARSGAPAVHTTKLEFGEYHPDAGIVGAGLFAFRRFLGGGSST